MRVRTMLDAAGCTLLTAGAVTVALYALPALQLLHRYTAMAAAFIPYGLPLFAGAAVIFATSPRRWLKTATVAALAGVALQVWWARPYWPSPTPAPTSGSSTLTLVTVNMRCNHPGTKDLAAIALRNQPDVVVVQGFQSTERTNLGTAFSKALPYRTFHPMPGLSLCGTYVFSRTPLRALASPHRTQPVVQVTRPSGPVVLLPVDLPTPSKGLQPWLDAFTHLTQAVTPHRAKPLIVAGDFNAVREHAPLRRLLHDTGLRDAGEVAGSGWTPTFPSRSWHPPLIGLDHALISAPLGASSIHTEPIRGQEHRALVVKLQPVA